MCRLLNSKSGTHLSEFIVWTFIYDHADTQTSVWLLTGTLCQTGCLNNEKHCSKRRRPINSQSSSSLMHYLTYLHQQHTHNFLLVISAASVKRVQKMKPEISTTISPNRGSLNFFELLIFHIYFLSFTFLSSVDRIG